MLSMKCQELPGAARSCPELQELLGAARSCQELPAVGTGCQELPELPRASTSCHELAGAIQSWQWFPGAARSWQELLPGAARSSCCQKLPGVALSCQKLARAARSWQELTEAAKSDQELPGAAASGLATKHIFDEHCNQYAISTPEGLGCSLACFFWAGEIANIGLEHRVRIVLKSSAWRLGMLAPSHRPAPGYELGLKALLASPAARRQDCQQLLKAARNARSSP